jgi:hypothetical protein
MPTLKLEIDQATYEKLEAIAVRERRTPILQAAFMLMQALLHYNPDKQARVDVDQDASHPS